MRLLSAVKAVKSPQGPGTWTHCVTTETGTLQYGVLIRLRKELENLLHLYRPLHSQLDPSRYLNMTVFPLRDLYLGNNQEFQP